MKALILAAGLGTRLRPLTDRLPKPLVPLFGRPLIVWLLEWLAEAGIRDVGINTHWLPEPLHDTLGDGARWGVRLHWQHEPLLLEGMGTVKSFDWLLGDETALCLNGDMLLDQPLAPLLATHRRLGAALTLLAMPQVGPLRSPVSWSADGYLCGIRQTGHDAPEATCFGEFAGVQVIEPRIWRDYLPAGQPCHLIRDLWPRLREAGVPLACHLGEGLWADVGSLDRLDAAHVLTLGHGQGRYLATATADPPGVWCQPGAQCAGLLRPPVWLGRDSRVEPGAILGPYGVLAPGEVLQAGQTRAWGVGAVARYGA